MDHPQLYTACASICQLGLFAELIWTSKNYKKNYYSQIITFCHLYFLYLKWKMDFIMEISLHLPSPL